MTDKITAPLRDETCRIYRLQPVLAALIHALQDLDRDHLEGEPEADTARDLVLEAIDALTSAVACVRHRDTRGLALKSAVMAHLRDRAADFEGAEEDDGAAGLYRIAKVFEELAGEPLHPTVREWFLGEPSPEFSSGHHRLRDAATTSEVA